MRSFLMQSWRFIVVGTAGTVLYLAMYVVLAEVLDTLLANVAAWTVSTVLTNEAHRRITFRAHDRARFDSTAGMLTSLLGLGLSSIAVALAEAQSTTVQLVALLAGTATAGTVRFVLLHLWYGDRAFEEIDDGGRRPKTNPIAATDTTRVSDDGVGFDTQRAHPGIGLREIVVGQLHRVGIDVHLDSEPADGTMVTMRGQHAAREEFA
ncbi:hypothetical protein EK0264_11105 [Epidermidibacterium keratini]|uniref:GtrA/DPMS transmembrane domain-containing protein n=1 Tax=Epidermidibacterium keratini TaxID=1891644 RepID=A0A7L4YQF1_9ACTN|nr:GtrA family protein [Epidermidibacterium keratini]QHC00777.1 hypothetical protein EK0264_11105 [Epidermidibacterium keratini]